MGSPWKMPNSDQGYLLTNNTRSEWTTINGKNGRKFINKSDSTKYIFFPAAGNWSNTYHNSAGSYGSYWYTDIRDSDSACSLGLASWSSGSTNYDYMYYGQSIRPIL